MPKPTMMAAEQAAELLGISTFDLSVYLRHAAADQLEYLAGRIRRDEDEQLDVARARRLHNAANAALAAWDEVAKAKAETA